LHKLHILQKHRMLHKHITYTPHKLPFKRRINFIYVTYYINLHKLHIFITWVYVVSNTYIYEVSAWLLAVLIVSVVYVTYTYMKFMWCDIHIHDVPASVLAVMIVNVIFIICIRINVCSIRLRACSAECKCGICDIYIWSLCGVWHIHTWRTRLSACSADCKCSIYDIYMYKCMQYPPACLQCWF